MAMGSTSAGQKQKRADSAEISEQITEHVGNDSVKHLELLEHVASKFKTNNPDVEPDKHVAAAVEMGGGEGFCLAEVESQGPYELDAGFDADGVAFQAGDEVLDVHKYEPVEQGSCTFVKTGKHFLVLVEDVRKTGIRPKVVASGGESRIRMSTRGRAGGSHSEGVERYVLCAKDKAEILASIVPPGSEPKVSTKTQADGVLQSGVQTLVGHGIEVSFDVGGEPTWEHGEICDVAADKIRVRYYSDNTRHWHRRFVLEHYDKKKSPLLVQAATGAAPLVGVMALSRYYWRLLDGKA